MCGETFENKSHQSINTCGHFLILTLYLASLCRTCQHAKNIIKQKQNWFCSVRKANMQRRHPGTIWRWESGSRGHPAGAAVGQHLSGETTLQPPFTPRLDMLHAYKWEPMHYLCDLILLVFLRKQKLWFCRRTSRRTPLGKTFHKSFTFGHCKGWPPFSGNAQK